MYVTCMSHVCHMYVTYISNDTVIGHMSSCTYRLTTLLSVCYTLQSLTASSAEGAVNLSSAVERLAAVMVSAWGGEGREDAVSSLLDCPLE